MKRDFDIQIDVRAKPISWADSCTAALSGYSGKPDHIDYLISAASLNRKYSRHRFHPGLFEQNKEVLKLPWFPVRRNIPPVGREDVA